MTHTLRRASLFALYQCTIAVGIALLPVALAVRKIGIPLPLHRAVRRLGQAYERTAR